MKSARFFLVMFGALFSLSAMAAYPQVEFRTNMGNFVVELYPDKAPKTVANFMQYVNSGFYEGTIFHRVVDQYVVQGGGLTAEMEQKKTMGPILNEADNGLKNERGTLAMSRKYDPHSATSQFFVNLANNKILNYYQPDAAHMGYCVFGRVIKGMDVVEKISQLPTRTLGRVKDVPETPVVIEKASVPETLVVAELEPQKEAEQLPVKKSVGKKPSTSVK
ncbi:MAG TPA: peptidylprolyl isomerase, partial [Methylophilaceae bacterium]|nr:peptidylprolyl isomerase [Methylophilaceae bacterium]